MGIVCSKEFTLKVSSCACQHCIHTYYAAYGLLPNNVLNWLGGETDLTVRAYSGPDIVFSRTKNDPISFGIYNDTSSAYNALYVELKIKTYNASTGEITFTTTPDWDDNISSKAAYSDAFLFNPTYQDSAPLDSNSGDTASIDDELSWQAGETVYLVLNYDYNSRSLSHVGEADLGYVYTELPMTGMYHLCVGIRLNSNETTPVDLTVEVRCYTGSIILNSKRAVFTMYGYQPFGESNTPAVETYRTITASGGDEYDTFSGSQTSDGLGNVTGSIIRHKVDTGTDIPLPSPPWAGNGAYNPVTIDGTHADISAFPGASYELSSHMTQLDRFNEAAPAASDGDEQVAKFYKLETITGDTIDEEVGQVDVMLRGMVVGASYTFSVEIGGVTYQQTITATAKAQRISNVAQFSTFGNAMIEFNMPVVTKDT